MKEIRGEKGEDGTSRQEAETLEVTPKS